MTEPSDVETHWKALGDLLQSGGMYDPAFLVGMVRGELASCASAATPPEEPDIELVAAVGRIIVNASRAEAQFDDGAEIVRLTKAIQQDARGIVRKWAALSSPSP